MNEMSPIDSLKGIGEKTRAVFERAGISDIGDLLHDYPRGYESYEPIMPLGEIYDKNAGAFYGEIVSPLNLRRVRRLTVVTGVIRDGTGTIQVTWFNMPYLKSSLVSGSRYVFRGKIVRKRQQMFLEQPAVFRMEEYEKLRGRLQPVYPLSEGLTTKMLQKAIRQALDEAELEKEYLPEEIRHKYNLAEYNYAIEEIHFPKDDHSMRLARHRLVFDEFLLFILAVRNLKEGREKIRPSFLLEKKEEIPKIIESLPFTLTGAQQKVWKELEADLTSSEVTARLIQGDVGSGKTILAELALFLAAENGYQGAIMVPTEVLARQHYESITSLVESLGLPYRTELLTGSMTGKQKRLACERIENQEVDIIVGTHALIQEKVHYKKLAVVITDEQHRFGVRQREALSQKGSMPHTIVMSATPIPRTLAVILYGDLDISIVNELPANRLPIKNCVVDTSYREKAYTFIKRQVEEGRQAYVICPMVEESEAMEAENVIEYSARLRERLPAFIQVEYLHGKMKPKEKNEIMERFLKNEIQVLVSTTVVEVGVNVPNATVMMIENAERFGLAQLHQLRGRVGRGGFQSYCILMYGNDGKKTKERLGILNRSNDGFYIAEEDLKLRGPGDLFGIRQSGILDFKLGDIFQDAAILKEASDTAAFIMEKSDKFLSKDSPLFKKMMKSTHLEDGMLNL